MTPMRGTTLIEAALALLLVGMVGLGLLGQLQLGLSLQRQQHWQALAIELAGELAERMQLNATHAVLYAQTWGMLTPPAGIDCQIQACTGEVLAQWDVAQWRQRVAQLPQGDARVMPLPQRPGWWLAQVAWRHDQAGPHPDSTDAPLAPCPVGMRCLPLVFQP